MVTLRYYYSTYSKNGCLNSALQDLNATVFKPRFYAIEINFSRFERSTVFGSLLFKISASLRVVDLEKVVRRKYGGSQNANGRRQNCRVKVLCCFEFRFPIVRFDGLLKLVRR